MKEGTNTPSEECYRLGFNLAHVVRVTGVSTQTLINWHRNKHQLFGVVLQGVARLDEVGAPGQKNPVQLGG